jgi:hypothetical protein
MPRRVPVKHYCLNMTPCRRTPCRSVHCAVVMERMSLTGRSIPLGIRIGWFINQYRQNAFRMPSLLHSHKGSSLVPQIRIPRGPGDVSETRNTSAWKYSAGEQLLQTSLCMTTVSTIAGVRGQVCFQILNIVRCFWRS